MNIHPPFVRYQSLMWRAQESNRDGAQYTARDLLMEAIELAAWVYGCDPSEGVRRAWVRRRSFSQECWGWINNQLIEVEAPEGCCDE